MTWNKLKRKLSNSSVPAAEVKRDKRQRGSAMVAVLILLGSVAVAGTTYLGSASEQVRASRRNAASVQTSNLCEAGIQSTLRQFWREFKISQTFTSMDSICTGATEASPRGSVTGSVGSVGRFSAGVVRFEQPGTDTYTRHVLVRAVGWIDSDGDGVVDPSEPVKVIDVNSTFQLSRSQVFDYTYFVNNYGWMDGFNSSNLIINGDMRANGNFAFLNGSPTVNGMVIATANEKLSPASAGTLTGLPVKVSNNTYQTSHTAGTNADNELRWRQAYNSTIHGARGSATYEQWRDIIFDSEAQISNGRLSGSFLADSAGLRSWDRQTSGTAGTVTQIDTQPSEEVIMPDLSELGTYQTLSQNYVDTKATYADGTANPFAGQGAWIEVWNSSTNSYQRITTNGVFSGSAVLVGTSTRPIRIHGPVTFSHDVLIKGNITGQGTVYAGRNVHIIGSIRYNTKPNFKGNSPTSIDNANEKADMLGLAARGSVIMGNTNNFTNTYPLQYMTPPFTKGRWDLNGNWIPPFNANDIDYTGTRRYKTVLGDTLMGQVAEGINQIDAVLYTNFVGGGNIGTGGGGVIFNGSIISKDEAMVVYSLPMRMNYDTRIKERSMSQRPLIDIQLPRSPVLLRSTWQDRGFSYAN